MNDRISDIKSTVEKLFSLLEDEILSQRMEINNLKREISALKELHSGNSDSRNTRNEVSAQHHSLPEVPLPKAETLQPSLQKREIVEKGDSIADKALKKVPAWMIDIPGEKVSSILSIIPLNDKLTFINNLFDSDEDQFYLTLERIEEMSSFDEVLNDMRAAFPEWNDSSDDVYRFYMFVRRKFRS